MDKKQFQQLRWAVEADIRNHTSDEELILRITNDVMRSVLVEFSNQAVARQRTRRTFLTFRKNPEVTPPSWAYRKPGLSTRIPTT